MTLWSGNNLVQILLIRDERFWTEKGSTFLKSWWLDHKRNKTNKGPQVTVCATGQGERGLEGHASCWQLSHPGLAGAGEEGGSLRTWVCLRIIGLLHNQQVLHLQLETSEDCFLNTYYTWLTWYLPGISTVNLIISPFIITKYIDRGTLKSCKTSCFCYLASFGAPCLQHCDRML